MGRYIPTIIQNADFFDELDTLTKEIEMKLESVFSTIEDDDGSSDYDEEDSDYDEEDDDGEK